MTRNRRGNYQLKSAILRAKRESWLAERRCEQAERKLKRISRSIKRK